MVARLVFRSLLVAGLFLAPAPVSRTDSRPAVAPEAHPARRTFTRRRSAAEEDEAGEFVHAIVRERAERPFGIVRA
jgi:hypothetical protein